MADGLTSLNSLSWGTSTAGAAVSAESTLSMGVDRTDVRVPPDTTRVWGAQLNAVKNWCIAVSATFKSGTRLGVATQSSNPFGATEQGLYCDASGNPRWSYNGVASTLMAPAFSAKGDVAVYNGSSVAVLPLGTDTFVLTADSTQPSGVKWAAGGASATGNWTFSGNDATLTGAGTMTVGTTVQTAMTIGRTNSPNTYNSTLHLLRSGTSDGAIAVALAADTTTTWSNATAKILSLRTNTSEKWFWTPGGNMGMPANASFTGASSATNTTGLSTVTTVADGASSIAFDYNNAATFSTTGWKMARWRNNGTEFASLTGSLLAPGGLRLLADGSAFIDMSLNGATNIGYGSNYIGIGTATCIFNGQGPRSDGFTTIGASGSLWPATWTKRLIPGTQNIAFSATPAFDPTAGNTIHFGPVTGNITGPTMVAGSPGERCTIVMVKDGTAGAYTVTASWGSNVRTTSSTFTTGAGSLIVLNFVWDDRLSTPAWVQMSGLGFN